MVKTYLLKLSSREEGPYQETQIAQMFADGRVNRNTPCKPASGGDWKSIDDYLPMLKYGTQLPPPTPAPNISATPSATPLSQSQRVAVVDFDIPFGSVLKIIFKWMAAGFIVACCFAPVVILVWLIVMALFAAFLGGAMSSLHHP
jgi:GYF domain 2